MARPATRVLPFPVLEPPDAQPTTTQATPPEGARCLLARHEVLLLEFTHEFLRVQRLAPSMTPQQVLVMQGERCLVARQLDAIEAAIKARVEREAKAIGLIA